LIRTKTAEKRLGSCVVVAVANIQKDKQFDQSYLRTPNNSCA